MHASRIPPLRGRSGRLIIHTIAAACIALAGIEESAARPNVLFVLTDQWRAQATGYAGDPNVKTPQLDRLAGRAVNFTTAVSVLPVCTPYRASLMTGRFPTSTGMIVNDICLPGDALCMAEIFKEAGYETGYIGKWHLDGRGRDAYIPPERRQGFDYWKVLECTHNYNNSLYYAGNDPKVRKWEGYDAHAQTKDAQNYIRTHAKKDNPFLLVMAYGGPHFPHHSAPEELKALYPPASIELRPNVAKKHEAAARREAQGYYAHCTALDTCVGDLLETLEETGEGEDTIVVFTSDHGEMLGSQGVRPKQKQQPWDESIRVPFLLRYPAAGADGGRVVKAPINTPDILPTLLSLAGIPIPDTIEGEDVSHLVLDPTRAGEDRAALFMNVAPFAGGNMKAFRGVRTARHSYIRYEDGTTLLFDNEADPYQTANLSGQPHAGLREKLEARLRAKLEKHGDEFLTAEASRKLWGLPRHVPYYFEHLPGGRMTKPENFQPVTPRRILRPPVKPH